MPSSEALSALGRPLDLPSGGFLINLSSDKNKRKSGATVTLFLEIPSAIPSEIME